MLGTLIRPPPSSHTLTHTHLLSFSIRVGQWPEAVGVHCRSQVRACERVQHSLLTVKQACVLASFYLHYTFFLFIPPKNPAGLLPSTHTHTDPAVIKAQSPFLQPLSHSCTNGLVDIFHAIKCLGKWERALHFSMCACFPLCCAIAPALGWISTINIAHFLQKPASGIANNKNPSPRVWFEQHREPL